MKNLAVLIIFLFSLSSAGQSVNFFREDITFSVDSVYFTVDGTYYFSNPTNKTVSFTVTYPVPEFQCPEEIDTLQAYDVQNPMNPVRVIKKDTLYFFRIQLAPKGEKAYSISYRQKHNAYNARYILHTTSSWGKPLKEANFDLLVPDYLTITGFSFEPDNYSDFKDDRIYHWKKKDFMPDKDFFITFIKTVK